ncbi:Plasmodium exported protein (PHISTa), unknown, putative [Plasmodium sp.]|nr:Plasmodium exported protein (PHISTa), unknown, putative [Plasmodium sp.]
MTNKKICTKFYFYRDDENRNEKLRYISFKLLCLNLCMIGYYYAFLNTSLVNKSVEIVNIGSVYERNLCEAEKNSKRSKRKKNFKRKKEDINKTKSNENNTKCNEQKVEDNKYSTNNGSEIIKVENKSNISISNINYNDISKHLTEKELLDVLNSFQECPSKEDLRNIWTHTLAVAKGVDDIEKELKASIQKYLDNDFLTNIEYDDEGFACEYIFKGYISRIFQAVTNEELLHSKNFFTLINNKHTLDDILKFIYSYLEHFKILKKELYEYHQKKLLDDIERAWYMKEHKKIKLK